MIIEIYLNTKKGVVKGTGTENLPPLGYCNMGRKLSTFHAKKTFVDFSQEEINMKNELEDIANEHGFELKTFDISRTRDAIRARSKGIHSTPAVIIGSHKFEHDFNISDIREFLFGLAKGNGSKEELKKYICPQCRSTHIKIYEDLSGYCNDCGEAFMKAILNH